MVQCYIEPIFNRLHAAENLLVYQKPKLPQYMHMYRDAYNKNTLICIDIPEESRLKHLFIEQD